MLTELCLLLAATLPAALGQDALGLGAGVKDYTTPNFDFQLVSQSQTLASLTETGNATGFDFIPADYMSRRTRNGQYHLGDITFRYRTQGQTTWSAADSAATRAAVESVTDDSSIASSNMAPTLPSNIPLKVVRSWKNVDGDLALEFQLTNTGSSSVEIGSLGFPIEFNSIFTDRTADETQQKCSLHDPYIGRDAGYVRVAPLKGTGKALVVTGLNGTSFEAWRNLDEASYEGTYYASQTFEGFYEWQAHTQAYAENEWKSVTPWNPATSRTLAPNESATYGLRFTLADDIKSIDAALKSVKTPVAVGVPGFIVPRDLTARLFTFAPSEVASVVSEPADAFTIKSVSATEHALTPSASAWGRVRVTVTYADKRVQTVHYYITKAGPDALSDLGAFATTEQYFTDESDPFGRAPGVITYDRDANAIHLQDNRAWISGLSDEAGAGSYLAATMKQAGHPGADGEIAKLEAFVNDTLWLGIQNADYSVKNSIFFYEPAAVPGYAYSSQIDWNTWSAWDRDRAYGTSRAYNYVHVIGAYWAMYRAARAYPDLFTTHDWQWYLDHAYQTVVSMTRTSPEEVGYVRLGLMGETVIGELLKDLRRENLTDEASTVEAKMKTRAAQWDTETVPFGSEMAWDSTGQEGVYYWSKVFGYDNTATKAVNTVLGFMPTVPHWGWNGNARRYWDNIYGGGIQRIERQIHHYGSGLNSLVLLSAFRANPSDSYLLRAGFGGVSGPLSSIDQDGYAAASFHSWPDTLRWDPLSGDYGPNHLGLVLGSASYVSDDADVGLVAFGGELTQSDGSVVVAPRDPLRKRAYVGPLGLLVEIDAGVIEEFEYSPTDKTVKVTLGQLANVPAAKAAVMWLSAETGGAAYEVKAASGVSEARGGWSIPLGAESVTVQLAPV